MRELNDKSFQSELESFPNFVIDFSAKWCMPCSLINPILEELAQENMEIRFAKVDIDKCPITASKLNIDVVPTLIFFKYGKKVEKVVGLRTKKQLEEILKRTFR